jgi:hypothetical protein
MPGAEEKRFRVLLLCDYRTGHANTVLDHIDAFRRLSRHDVRTFNPVGMYRSVALDLEEFDVVVIHYSLVLPLERYISADFREKLRRYRGLKIQFVQDEYRWVNLATAAMRDVGVDILFTCAPEPAAGQLYNAGLSGVRRVQTLTGYVPPNLQDRPRRPLVDRSIDVGYRGRDLPFWLGRLTQEKTWIGQGFLERAPKYGLRVDIGWREKDRIYGEQWIEFISSCRATLSTESGASIADFDGSVERAVRLCLNEHPAAEYQEVYEAVLRPFEGNVVVNVISPRVFEAAALGTALVMFPGTYSNIARPGEHYITLEKDFSNMDDVVARLKDIDFLNAMVERAYEHLIASGRWSYASFIRQFDDVVSQEARPIGIRPMAVRHRLAMMERALRVPPLGERISRPTFAAISTLSGGRFKPSSRPNVRALVGRSTLAVGAVLGDSELRTIFREGVRAGMARDALMEELVKFAVLRRATRGELKTIDAFSVSAQYDAAGSSIRFMSRPASQGVHPVNGSVRLAREALRAGTIQAIEWDHSSLGTTVRLRKPRVELGIGPAGLKRFTLLAEIGRRKPTLLEHALASMVGPEEIHESRLG